jgi:hypothetical protein
VQSGRRDELVSHNFEPRCPLFFPVARRGEFGLACGGLERWDADGLLRSGGERGEHSEAGEREQQRERENGRRFERELQGRLGITTEKDGDITTGTVENEGGTN